MQLSDASPSRDELVEQLEQVRAERDQLQRAVQEFAKHAQSPWDADASPRAQRFRDLLDAMGAAVLFLDDDGVIVDSSLSIEAALGYPREAVLNRSLHDFVHPEDRDSAQALFAELENSEQARSVELRLQNKRGEWRHFHIDMPERPVADQNAMRKLLYIRDVTEFTRPVHALRESESRYRALAENLTDLIIEIDDAGNILYVSPSSLEILDLPPEMLVGHTIGEMVAHERVHADDRALIGRRFEQILQSQTAPPWSYRVQQRDGTWRTYESRARSYRHDSGDMHTVLVSRDVTELIRAQTELHEIEKRLDLLGSTSRDVITETNPQRRFVYVTATAKQVLGFAPEEAVRTLSGELIHPDDRERVTSDFWESETESGVSFTPPYRCRCADGSYRWCEGTAVSYFRADGSGPWVIGLLRDVQERIRMRDEQRSIEQKMERAQRLEGLGVMAGGIAHDFNNLLTPILGQASLALMDLPESSALHQRLRKIRSAARHAAKLTNQMLAYAGAGQLVLEAVDLSQLVREIGPILENSATGSTMLNFELDPDLEPIEADGAQMSQVVMNLITNALEAVDDDTGAIELRTARIRGRDVQRHDLVVGEIDDNVEYVCLEVSDNGVGMDAETRGRIFDPFFTTKFTGRGLGLAAVVGIVSAHEGAVGLRTSPDLGTHFQVYIPRGHPDAATPQKSRPSTRWQTSGTVLVVDDDAGVRDLAEETLRRCGLTPLAASDGGEAVQMFRRHCGELRAVLLDRAMPTMSGERTLLQMREIDPSVPVVLISGYAEERAAAEFAGAGLDGFLQKPFSPDALIDLLRSLLERGDSN